jgi:hypothetical protein
MECRVADVAIVDVRTPHLDGFGDPVAVLGADLRTWRRSSSVAMMSSKGREARRSPRRACPSADARR